MACFNRISDAQKPSEPGAAAHMSLHQSTMSKNRQPNIRSGQPWILEKSSEDLAILDIGDRAQRKPEGITASVEWHLGASNESVNRKNRISENFLRSREKAGFRSPALPEVRLPLSGDQLALSMTAWSRASRSRM